MYSLFLHISIKMTWFLFQWNVQRVKTSIFKSKMSILSLHFLNEKLRLVQLKCKGEERQQNYQYSKSKLQCLQTTTFS